MNPISPTPSIPPQAAAGEALGGATTVVDPALAGFAALVERLVSIQTQSVRPPAGPTTGRVLGADAPAGAPGDATASDEPADTDGQPAAVAAPALVAVGPLPVGPVTTGDPGATAGAAPRPVTADGPTATVVPVTALPGTAPADGTAPGTAAPADTTAESATTPPPAGQPAQPVTPTATPAPPASAAGAPPAPAAPAAPGPAQQVLPEVARLVSRGDGTHRLTMTLQPELLGEVRITLTIRNGEVQVRLAAGEQAKHALREGAPELQRVLELAGATDTRVVVRDLPGGPAAASSTSSGTASHAQTNAQASTTTYDARADHGAAGHGRGDSDSHHARTRGGPFAMDGADDGAVPLRHDPVRPARATGLDLTM